MENVSGSVTVAQQDRDLISELKREHAVLEEQLAAFDSKPYLTPVEQLERKRIQKLKLAKKDQLHVLLKQHCS